MKMHSSPETPQARGTVGLTEDPGGEQRGTEEGQHAPVGDTQQGPGRERVAVGLAFGTQKPRWRERPGAAPAGCP